ncbi:DUF2785 domain-containing protein [Paenibacillus puldeungensis]|uniref:DUF2785 domain-containing protein n=1 Tax=Paenibacillus puldeungensis TaxID=696536 RepID=A0ABW3RVQ1_9BACL
MDITKAKLKEDLQRIKKEQYQLREGERHQEFVTQMVQYIGDPDPELRDELIYSTFYHWIHLQGFFTEMELRSLLAVLLDEQHLFYQIGSEGDETVFTRAFSVLPIALIMERHRKQPFLEPAEFLHLKQSLLRYYREENDLRGYLSEGGWAHSAAHGADALDELAQCPESDAAVQREILVVIQGKLQNGKHVFNNEEDERIANIVDTMSRKTLLPAAELASWLAGLAVCDGGPGNRSQYISRINCKNFIRCLYFRGGHDQQEESIQAALFTAEAALNRFR